MSVEMRRVDERRWPSTGSDGADIRNGRGERYVMWHTAATSYVRDHILQDAGAHQPTPMFWQLERNLNWPWTRTLDRRMPFLYGGGASSIVALSNDLAVIRATIEGTLGAYDGSKKPTVTRDFHLTGADLARFLEHGKAWAPRVVGSSPEAFQVDGFENRR